MIDSKTTELFLFKCALIQSTIKSIDEKYNNKNLTTVEIFGENLEKYILQFEAENRNNAAKMSKYYEIFYMLENDIRKLIVDTMTLQHGNEWWTLKTPQVVKDEAKKNREREETEGVSLRSDEEIDYTTFGQLGEIIKANYVDFAGIFSNQSAVSRVLRSLNMLRGTIAHCGMLAEDEIDRLKLHMKDWFRILEGPKPT